MIFLRTIEEAPKCLLRLFRREELTRGLSFIFAGHVARGQSYSRDVLAEYVTIEIAQF